MKGIRVFPKYHDYEITDSNLIELVKRARDLDVPVAFTYRMADSRLRSWMDIDYVVGTPKPEWTLKNIFPIIKAVPDAKFMILNVANSMHLDEADNEQFKKTQVLIDTSGRTLLDLGSLLKTQGRERFAFGTHSPILDYVTGLLRIESLRATEADAATKELLRSGNATRFLKL
jgi:predicted TIM-barrel fold metal-dependent hydrolase